MWSGGMRNHYSLSVSVSSEAARARAAASFKQRLPFGVGGGEIDSSRDPSAPVKKRPNTAVNNSKDVASRKRGASGSSKLVPKTTMPPRKAHRHCQTTSLGPSLHMKNVVTSSNRSSSATPTRTLEQSAAPTTGTTSTPRSSAAKLAKHHVPHRLSSALTRSSSRRRVIAPHGEVQPIEPEDDHGATFCHEDHNVQVFIRARPVSDAESAQRGKSARCVKQENARTVAWLGQPETRFTFDHVADEFVTQAELFRVAGLRMVENCMAGYNSCMFAYGQTGSGKTHTMLGEIGDFENQGMTPRVFEHLFARIRKEEEAQKQAKLKYKCRCSFLEIYNEQICDLLEPSSTNLQMREDGKKKGVFVEGLLEVEVQTVQDVLHLLLLGVKNRKVAATHMNRESSRSHSVFTCVIESQWECDSMINFRFGRLNLVDLAGSERQKGTGVDEERLREAASINKSLSSLGLVIMVLANGKQRHHVPYRDSKLTFLLQDSLGGNSKTTIIANISPSSCASSETLSTLKFAQRAKFIQNNAVVNEEASGDNVKGLQEQIQYLKDELAHVRRQSIGRAVPGPTVLNHKIKAMEALLVGVLRREKLLAKTSAAEIEHLALLLKQREVETTGFHKSQQSANIRSEANCDAEASSGAPSELVLQCKNLEHRKLAVENIHLQKRLRRCQEYDVFEEREQDISNLRNKQETLVAELAAEKHATEQLRNEVETCRRDFSECQTKLQTSLDSNERTASELDALRMELESSRDECSLHKRDLGALQLKQAQHQQVVFELKTQLQKSEEKAEQETIKRSQVELQLQQALQESINLQTELQWTRDSLEETEAVVESGDSPEAAYEAFVVGQMQAEIIEMHARLEEERRRGRELEAQIKTHNNSNLQESQYHNTNNDHQNQNHNNTSNQRKVRHQDAILQLQMELSDSVVDVGASQGSSLQAINIQLQQQLEDLTQAKLKAEKALNLVDLETTENDHLTSTTQEDEKELSKLQQAELKEALVFSLDTENADYLQHQLILETEADSTALKSTIASLHRELQEMDRNRSQLQKEVRRKQSAIQALEKHLLAAHQNKLQCQEKQVEVEILAKSVEELENTVYALESQVGLLKREGNRQCLVREAMESELQALKHQNALTEAISPSGGAVRRESNAESPNLMREGNPMNATSWNWKVCLKIINMRTKKLKA